MNQGATESPLRIKCLRPFSDEKADLAVVMVSWNVKEALAENLTSLKNSSGDIKVRLIVVDNASTDGTAEAINDGFKEVTIIENPENLGFAKAANQGLAVANSRHVLLLNPDMKVEPQTLELTVEYLDSHPEVGVLGAGLSRPDGTVLPSVRRFPDVWSQLAILLKLTRLFPKIAASYLMSDFDYSREQDVPSVRGSYLAISRQALEKIGGLDERYFIWFEEVDYCQSAIKAGLKVRYVPSIIATDLFGRSFAQRGLYWKQKNFSLSMARYFWKWHPGWRALLISVIRIIPVSLAWLVDAVHIR